MAAMLCSRVSPVPPDFEMATNFVVSSGSLASRRCIGVGIEIVDEMDARLGREARQAGDAVIGELRQRLAAEARAAGAEHEDVGRAGLQPGRGVLHRGEVGGVGGQAEQRQRPVLAPAPSAAPAPARDRPAPARRRHRECRPVPTPDSSARSKLCWSMDTAFKTRDGWDAAPRLARHRRRSEAIMTGG